MALLKKLLEISKIEISKIDTILKKTQINPEPKSSKNKKQKKSNKDTHNLFSIKNPSKKKTQRYKIIPTGIKEFDSLISDRGVEKGSTLLISGGAGTGKTTFSIQSMYHSAMTRGERGIYLSFEEEPEKIKLHMKKNYGWDLNALEKKGLFAIIKLDSVDIARSVEQILMDREDELKIDLNKIELPFTPDKIAIDSLSALSIAFTNEENYRKYIRELFESLEQLDCVTYVIAETEQDPKIYSRTGVEEFLADGVVVLYNLKRQGKRENAIEILKLRSSSHKKGMIPYKLTEKGITIQNQ